MSEKMERHMGDDDKIKARKDIIIGSESRFLPDEIRDLESQAEVYSLEQEFARTKKNRNYKLQIFVVLFIAVLFGLAALYTLYLEREAKDITVDIKEFNDIRLREFLDSAKNQGSDIDIMKIQLQVLRVEMLNAILDVKQQYQTSEMKVIAQGASQEEINQQLEELRAEEEKAVKRVRGQYVARIARQKREIAKMERNKQDAEQKARKGETFISSEDRLHQIKMDRLKKSHESGLDTMKAYYDEYINYVTLQYNPKFISNKLDSVIDTFSKSEGENSLKGIESLRNIQSGSVNYSRLFENINSLTMIIDRILWIPFVNSMKPAVASLSNLTSLIINDFTRAVNEQDALISNYSGALNHVLDESKKNERWGFIINAANPRNIYCHMKDARLASEGATASVYRLRSGFGSREDYVGKIKLFRKGCRVMASVVSLAKGEKLQPVDLYKIDK